LKPPHSTSGNSLESMLTAPKVYPSIPPPGKRQEVLMRTPRKADAPSALTTIRFSQRPVKPRSVLSYRPDLILQLQTGLGIKFV
jgi:hypothetical protein